MFDRLDFILRMRISRKPAIVGIAFLGMLVLSLALYLFLGKGMVSRVLYFPRDNGRHGLVAEQRFVPRHAALEKDIAELAAGILLGPTHVHAQRLFPRGGQVAASMLSGRTLYLDLSPDVLVPDPEVPVTVQEALSDLERSIRFNFPRIQSVVFLIDGQQPRFGEKKKI